MEEIISITIIGTLVNTVAVLIGGSVGLLLKGKIPEKFAENIIKAVGLCVCIIGIKSALGIGNTEESKVDIMLVVISLALGAFIGELLRIENYLNRLGQWMQKKMSRKDETSTFAEGFVVATLLFCVGAMAVIGSIESGLGGDRTTIYTKSLLDGVSSMVLASSLGLGVLFSAVAIFLYQGSIEVFAGSLQNILTPDLITQVSAVGGVMILGIGLNMTLSVKIRVANLLPGLLVAVGYYYAMQGVKIYIGV